MIHAPAALLELLPRIEQRLVHLLAGAHAHDLDARTAFFYFATLAEIIDSLAKAEREGRLAQRIGYITRPALLIIDEVGYLPVQKGGANLFFQLINARYERGAVILTSNRGFSEWGEVFGDTVVAAALLDRLLHHAIVIEIAGNSYRLREHAKLVPENLRLPPVTAPAPKRRRGRPPKTAPN